MDFFFSEIFITAFERCWKLGLRKIFIRGHKRRKKICREETEQDREVKDREQAEKGDEALQEAVEAAVMQQAPAEPALVRAAVSEFLTRPVSPATIEHVQTAGPP